MVGRGIRLPSDSRSTVCRRPRLNGRNRIRTTASGSGICSHDRAPPLLARPERCRARPRVFSDAVPRMRSHCALDGSTHCRSSIAISTGLVSASVFDDGKKRRPYRALINGLVVGFRS